MGRGINLSIRDEHEGEEEEANVEVEVILNQEEEMIFRAIYKIGKRPKFEAHTMFGKS